MTEETFWKIVDEARADAYDDDEAFLRGLENSLMELPPNAIEGFRDRLDDIVRSAFRWDLWAAAYIINRSASEDGFEYFRGWLVSRGRSVYEGALHNPETLTDLVPLDSEWFAEFEEFLYLPIYTLEQKTGKNGADSRSARDTRNSCRARRRTVEHGDRRHFVPQVEPTSQEKI